MCSIAKGLVFCVFAHTKPCFPGFFRRERVGLKAASLVGAVTEGLRLRESACAEIIGFPGLEFDLKGRTPGNIWFVVHS
jgi:hypothetical protein